MTSEAAFSSEAILHAFYLVLFFSMVATVFAVCFKLACCCFDDDDDRDSGTQNEGEHCYEMVHMGGQDGENDANEEEDCDICGNNPAIQV